MFFINYIHIPQYIFDCFFSCFDHYFMKSIQILCYWRIEWPLNSFVCFCLLDFSWFSWFSKSFNSLFVLTNLPALSEKINSGIPLRLAILKNAFKNKSVSILNDISKCIARIFRQVNKHKYRFALLICLPVS